MVQKAVNIEAKAGLKSTIMIWDLDIYCLQNYYSSNNTASKVQIQNSKHFSCPKESKSKDPKSALSYNNMAELPKKNDKKDKKKRF